MVPARVALALQADGWWVRRDIIWAKDNPMPESVTDRCTSSHEYVFHLAKAETYFYDQEAIREPCQSGSSDIRKMEEQRARIGGKHKTLADPLSKANEATNIGQKRAVGNPAGRNRRDVWQINTEPCPLAHFAVMPTKLVELCIKASTSEYGVCGKCRVPWVRLVSRGAVVPCGHGTSRKAAYLVREGRGRSSENKSVFATGTTRTRGTVGWRPCCSCYDDRYRAEFPQASSARKRWQRQRSGDWWRRARRRPGKLTWPTVPAVVLDPFAGSGTVGLVALRLGRRAILIDAKPEYCAMAQERVAQLSLVPAVEEPVFVAEPEQQSLPLD